MSKDIEIDLIRFTSGPFSGKLGVLTDVEPGNFFTIDVVMGENIEPVQRWTHSCGCLTGTDEENAQLEKWFEENDYEAIPIKGHEEILNVVAEHWRNFLTEYKLPKYPILIGEHQGECQREHTVLPHEWWELPPFDGKYKWDE